LSFNVFGFNIFHLVKPIRFSSQNTISSNKSNIESINDKDNLSLELILLAIISYNEVFSITSFFFLRILIASL